MKLPEKLNRKALKLNFTKLSNETWEYIFDHEKENGLVSCRTEGYGVKLLWYSTDAVKSWLVNRCYYMPEDFDEKPRRLAGPWSALLT